MAQDWIVTLNVQSLTEASDCLKFLVSICRNLAMQITHQDFTVEIVQMSKGKSKSL